MKKWSKHKQGHYQCEKAKFCMNVAKCMGQVWSPPQYYYKKAEINKWTWCVNHMFICLCCTWYMVRTWESRLQRLAPNKSTFWQTSFFSLSKLVLVVRTCVWTCDEESIRYIATEITYNFSTFNDILCRSVYVYIVRRVLHHTHTKQQVCRCS